MTRILNGWLLDVYAAPHGGVSVWILDAERNAHHLHDSLTPMFFVRGTRVELRRVCEWLQRAGLPVTLSRATRYDLFARQDVTALQVNVHQPWMFSRVVQRVTETFPALEYSHADLTIAQFYFFERDLFPLCKCEVEIDADGNILNIAANDSRWALDYELPPLRVLRLRLEPESAERGYRAKNPAHGFRAPLQVEYDERCFVLDLDKPRAVMARLREHLLQCDPDLILTDYGDAFLLNELDEHAREVGIELPWNRDAAVQVRTRRARSRFSHGQILYQPEARWLFGRLHIDRQSSFLFHDYDLVGAFEVARLSQRAVQQSVRSSTGGAISAMETATAYQSGCWIPLEKSETEEFQTANELIASDRGGVIYQPIAGVHYDVAELDFVAMYPSIMVQFNVSGETMNCSCCQNFVPELKSRVCVKRQGLIPATIGPLVEKRFAYKKLKRATPDARLREIYAQRDSAAKWILVTCFGFAGHKHAKFGLVTAHAAVCAYGRENILRAKEVVEKFGYRVLHIITDSVWIQKKNVSDAELQVLVNEIERVTHLPIALEARYKWVAFLNSRVDARRSVPNRYFAATYDGETKLRGIEARRHDTPLWIVETQCEMIHELAPAHTRGEIAERIPRVMQILTRELDRLRAGQVPLHLLTISSSISRLPSEYQVNNLNAAIARQLEEHGAELHAGEGICYIVTDKQATLDCDRAVPWDLANSSVGYDVKFYQELYLRACENVLSPFGIRAEMLRDGVNRMLPIRVIQKQIAAKATPYWGPLFELLY